MAAGAALLLAIGGLSACTESSEQVVVPFQGAGIGINTEDIDTAIDPGNDFYRYANGKWLAMEGEADDYGIISRRARARGELDRRLTTIVEDLAGRPQRDGTAEALIRDYYRLFMDRDAIDDAGIRPARGDIQRFQSVETIGDLSRVIGGTLRAASGPASARFLDSENLFAVAALSPAQGAEGTETADSTVAAFLVPGGLGIPDRDSYLDDGGAARADRAAYRDLVARTLSLAGLDGATARADGVLALEVKLAAALGDGALAKTPEIWTREELEAAAPGLDWAALLDAASLGEEDRFASLEPDAIAGYSALAASENIGAWRDWLTFHRLNSHALVLPSAFERAHFSFYEERLQGRRRPRSVETAVVDQIGMLFPGTLGRLYAERYFSADEKREVDLISQRIHSALIAQLEAAGADGVSRLKALTVHVGYPESYAEIARLNPIADNAYATTIAAERAAYAREISRIGREKANGFWPIGPHRIRVLYDPAENAINIPAAILQPPYYDPESDAAANFGAIGAMIGREMARAAGFAMRDEDDNSRADRNIAGLRAAYDAYRASLEGREPRVIEGFSGDQRFFIAFAQLWAEKADGRRTQALGEDEAAPARVEAVRHVDAWYRAFDVQSNDALFLTSEQR